EPAEASSPPASAPESDMIAAVIAFADEEKAPAVPADVGGEAEARVAAEFEAGAVPEPDGAEDEVEAAPDDVSPVQYRITGRGFTPLGAALPTAGGGPLPPEETEDDAGISADPEIVERVSRYNFDELSRILSDRVSGDAGSEVTPAPPPEPPRRPTEGAL